MQHSRTKGGKDRDDHGGVESAKKKRTTTKLELSTIAEMLTPQNWPRVSVK